MSIKENTIPATEFFNIQVVALPVSDPKTGKTKYNTSFTPESITITQPDAVINYQLVTPTPAGVKIKEMTSSPDSAHELSIPSIGVSGKLVTFSDANTVKADIHVTLHFIDTDNIEFSEDPEIINDPIPTL